MRKICVVSLVHQSFDIATIVKEAFARLKVDVEVIEVPHFLLSELTTDRVDSLKQLLKQKSLEAFVIFFPDTTELFFQEPDLTLAYSAYRTWFDEKKTRVIPHLWTPVGLPSEIDGLTWKEKPPLRIGFMGRSHATSRLATSTLRLPKRIKEWLLLGKLLQHPNLIAKLNELGLSIQNINTFPRIEAIQTLLEKSQKRDFVGQLEIVERQGFGGTEHELSEYKNHLRNSTYVICARGSENYSFRLYETLNYGRIPVIVDTEMVLPKEIDWQQLSVIVPYKFLNDIYDAIVSDYQTHSASEFIERQQNAFSTMSKLQTMDWVTDLAKDIVENASR